MPWLAAAIPALVSVGTSIYSANQQTKNANKAIDAQKQIQANLKYEPIDIEKLKKDAQATAIENATNSLAIERNLQPEVAATRTELARQVNRDLSAGGNLPADVANSVTTAGRVVGSRSGIGSGGTVPLTASLLGINSLDLINQRRASAERLLANNELPVSGLDPGTLASAEVAQNAANNQFNLEKAGVASNLANSEAAARSAQIGGQTGIVSSLANLLGKGAGRAAESTGTSLYDSLLNNTVKSKVQPSIDYLGNATTMSPYIVKGG